MNKWKGAISAIMLVIAVAFSMSLSAVAFAVEGQGSLVSGMEQAGAPAQATSISSASMVLPKSVYDYTGKAVKPVPTIKVGSATLKYGSDFKLTYKANTKVGTATVTATGLVGYTGSISKTFRIAYPVSKAKVSKIKATTYNGKAHKPKLKVKYGKKTLKKGRDYKLAYSNNKNAGKAKVSIVGKGNYNGTKVVKFKIAKASLGKAKVASISKKKYTGSKIAPKPKVKLAGKKLKKGRDYKLSYSNNKKAGTAKIKIKGIGNYRGSKTVTFKIYKKAKKSSSGSSGSRAVGTVYWTPNGEVYHLSSDCPTLSRSRTILSGSVSDSGRSRCCKVCG